MPVDFGPALVELEREGRRTYGPRSFSDYCDEHGLGRVDTATAISVDFIKKLDRSLRDSNTMVFRLGRHDGSGTSFGLATAPSGNINEFFLIDVECMDMTEPQLFLPDVSARALFPFQLMPKLTETSLVNLAVGSGLLHRALDLDGHIPSTPATGQSTFTFSFRPMPGADVWQHQQGQVEIDAMFTAQRNGRETLFLVEAKDGKAMEPNGDLAKHKLVYPYAALRNELPDYMDIVPVYLKAWRAGGDRHFLVVECGMPGADIPVITELSPKQSQHLVLRGF